MKSWLKSVVGKLQHTAAAPAQIGLEIILIAHSNIEKNNYAIVLGELGGARRLPVVIGAAEAQAIVVVLEGIIPPMPLTHDLMHNAFQTIGLQLAAVVIYALDEGVFHSKLVCLYNARRLEIKSRTSDAIALAVRFNCPIYTYENILEAAAMYDDFSSTKPGETADQPTPEKTLPPEVTASVNDDLNTLSLEELNGLLQQALGQEDYKQAIAICSEMDSRKKE